MCTPIFASGKFVCELIFAMDSKNLSVSIDTASKWARKGIHHYLSVWDKEIPPSD